MESVKLLNFCLSKTQTSTKQQEFSLWEVVESVSCSYKNKQIKLFDTRAIRLVSEKFRLVKFHESNGPVKNANRKLSQ